MLESLIAKLTNKVPDKFVSIDIGASNIKLFAIDTSGPEAILECAACVPTPANALKNNEVKNSDTISSVISSALQANDIEADKAVFCLPGPAVFTKKVTLGYMPISELEANISFEATNYIPDDINSVHLDFQVLKSDGKSSMEVLLVAIKNEIIKGYLDAISGAGLEPAIADVDYFALENMFEFNYPEEKEEGTLIALLDVGSRFTGVSILRGQQQCFVGDVSVGGRLYTDALCETLGVEPSVAEQVKSGVEVEGVDQNLLSDTLDRTTEHIASEIHRQLGFFWSAAELDSGIEKIYITGGASRSPGLVDQLSTKTGLECVLIDPFRKVNWNENFDQEFIQEISPTAGVAVGLAMRRFSDKVHLLE